MKKDMLSLRARAMLGAALWSVGLFVVAGVVATAMMLHYRQMPNVLHAMFAHALPSTIVAIVFMLAGFWHVKKGLAALHDLRSRLAAVRGGRERQIEGRYPAEVQPLVTELNALLDHTDRAVSRAVAKAGDLAHGLKTPLAVLSREAERAGAAGHHDLAATLGEQVERMRRQMDYHLAQARAAASGATAGARSSVIESAEGLSRALLRLHADRGVAIDVHVPPEHAVRSHREDLDEMLGNLLETPASGRRRASPSNRRPTARASSSRSTTTGRDSRNRCATRFCSAAYARTKPRPAPGSASPSFAISRSCTAGRSH